MAKIINPQEEEKLAKERQKLMAKSQKKVERVSKKIQKIMEKEGCAIYAYMSITQDGIKPQANLIDLELQKTLNSEQKDA
jgi:hypothetical protein